MVAALRLPARSDVREEKGLGSGKSGESLEALLGEALCVGAALDGLLAFDSESDPEAASVVLAGAEECDGWVCEASALDLATEDLAAEDSASWLALVAAELVSAGVDLLEPELEPELEPRAGSSPSAVVDAARRA